MTGAAREDAVSTPAQRDRAGDEFVAVVLADIARLARNQQRLELDTRRLGLDVQRLDATVQLMGTSVGSLSDEVRQLGSVVHRLETKLDLSRQVVDFHLHTMMNHVGVPLAETLHSARPVEPDLLPPGEAGG